MSTSLPQIKVPLHFERDFGKITSVQEVLVIIVLREFMSEVRRLHGPATNGEQGCPSYCKTCALDESTDSWKGFLETAYGFMWSFCNAKPFLCHSNQSEWQDNTVDPSKLVMCGGFKGLAANHLQETIAAAFDGMEKIKAIVRR